MHPSPALALWLVGSFSISVVVRDLALNTSGTPSRVSFALPRQTGSPPGSPSDEPVPEWTQ